MAGCVRVWLGDWFLTIVLFLTVILCFRSFPYLSAVRCLVRVLVLWDTVEELFAASTHHRYHINLRIAPFKNAIVSLYLLVQQRQQGASLPAKIIANFC